MIRLFALLIAVVLVALVATKGSPAPEATSTILYSCSGERTITAIYTADKETSKPTPDEPQTPAGKVKLVLSDGRTYSLIQTVSADGVRYGNADESFVFWIKGNGALVLEDNEQKSFVGCIAVLPEPEGTNLPRVYSNAAAGFSIRLPADYRVNESYRYTPSGPAGIQFAVSTSTTAGTNLADDTSLTVELIPNAATCSAALFLPRAKAYAVTDGAIAYSIATSTGAAAGNRYDELVFAIPETNPCLGIRYFIHYGAIQNYATGTVKEFDKESLLATFDAIRRTLVFFQ
jgi:membrane-bound inhibitor of C-type lysozyme